eukprot:scaffold92140_cov20-Prasinocladus_malaysianus.AAC.1
MIFRSHRLCATKCSDNCKPNLVSWGPDALLAKYGPSAFAIRWSNRLSLLVPSGQQARLPDLLFYVATPNVGLLSIPIHLRLHQCDVVRMFGAVWH